MGESIQFRGAKRRSRIAGVILVVAVAAAPLGAWASHMLADVPTDHPFHDDIAAVAEAGVTRGCNPPTNDQFCPDDNVTRGQMAAFMNRLGALSGGTPVVNAATAQEALTVAGWSPDELVRVAWANATPQVEGDVPVAPAHTGPGTLLETTIEAPRDGFLIVTAHSEAANYVETDFAICGVIFDQATLVASSVGIVQHDQTVTDAEGRPLVNQFPTDGEAVDLAGVNMEEDCVGNTVIPVRAGPHDLAFEALFALPTTEWWAHSLSVLYVPFDGEGNPPTDFEVMAADRGDLESMRTQILDRASR